MKIHRKQGQRGYLFFLSIWALFFLTAWVGILLQRSGTEVNAASLHTTTNKAFQAAEAGLDQAISNLRTISATDDLFAGQLVDSAFTIANPLTVLGPLLYQADVTGAAVGVERNIEAILQVTPLSLFRFGLFGDQGVILDGNASVDSYDSRNGPYDPVLNANSNGNVGTNSTAPGAIDLNGSDYFVDGQLSVGPDVSNPASIVDGLNPTLVTGDPPVVSSPEFPLPEVKVPPGLPCPDLSLQGSTVWTLTSPGPHCFNNLQVKGGATLTANGPVTVYLVGSLSFEGESVIGVVNEPSKFLLLMTSGSVAQIDGAVAGEAQMYAALYGPDATISIDGHADIFGSVVGSNVTLDGDAELHYDEALADQNILSNEGIVDILSWREVP